MNKYTGMKRRMARAATILDIPLPQGFDPKPNVIGQPARQLARSLNLHYFKKNTSEVSAALLKKCDSTIKAAAIHENPGKYAVAYLRGHVGAQETWGKNQGPLLQAWAERLQQLWMYLDQQPWCAEAVQASFLYGANLDLAKLFPSVSWVYCPSIVTGIRNGKISVDGKWALSPVAWANAVIGTVCLFDWQGDGTADHIGLVISRDGDTLYTIEGNTPKSNIGDQSGLSAGDGIWLKERDRSEVIQLGKVVAR